MLHTIAMVLEENFGEIATLEHPERLANSASEWEPKVIVLDLNFSVGDASGGEGLAWVPRIKANYPHAAIVILTAHGFLDIAVKSLK